MSSEKPNPYALSVRTLAEFALEGGDLFSDAAALERMQDGIKGHRALQSQYGEGFRAEVPLRIEAEIEGVLLHIRGRIDGLYQDESSPASLPILEEIKTTQRPVDTICQDDYPVHWAQVEIYAHMLCQEKNLPGAIVRLVYYNLGGSCARFEREWCAPALSEKFQTYAHPYVRWIKALESWLRQSRPSIHALCFPFERYLPGQMELTTNTYIALRDGKYLLAEAPTGIGKTVSTLFGAIKALGEGRVERIFYLTARTTTRAVAESTIERMRGQGLSLRSLTLTAKDKICPFPDRRCTPELCERARGYYDRRRAVLFEALTMQRLGREQIEALAAAHCLCPFELSLDLSETADIIICDYNHAFDPRVKLKRFFLDGGKYALLVDEAHNLIDRAREMHSAALELAPFELLRRDAGKLMGRKGALYRRLSDLISALKKLRTQHDEPACLEVPPEEILPPLEKFSEAAGALVTASEPHPLADALVDLHFAALLYIRTLENYGNTHRTLIEPMGKRGVRLKLWCFDPAPLLRECYKKIQGAVLFSATLSPLASYFDALGLHQGEGDAKLRLRSPFDPANLCALRIPIATRFAKRTQTTADVAAAILSMCSAKTGNYLACFPSHAYLRAVAEALEPSGIRLLAQSVGMDDDARRTFLAAFVDSPQTSMLALITMGGIFSEGVDLPGERLSGAAIVGVGLPQISFERDNLRTLQGYRQAYVYPGIERVLQAAGRVIRTQDDRGVVLLIDERFFHDEYASLLPPHWSVRNVRSAAHIAGVLDAFWSTGLGTGVRGHAKGLPPL